MRIRAALMLSLCTTTTTARCSIMCVVVVVNRFTHEAGGVVVTRGLGVTERLQDRVGLHNLVLQGALQQRHGDTVRRHRDTET